MDPELRRLYHDRLASIHGEVTGMVRAVAAAVPDATAAVLGGDMTLAERVAAGVVEVHTTCANVEIGLVDLIAREAPVARDLRFVLATLRIVQSLERCADLTRSVARRTGRVDAARLNDDIRGLIVDLGASASEMLGDAADAYAVLDEGLAAAVAGRDDAVDDLHARVMRALFAGTGGVEPTVELAFVARFFERIADHAVVIAERVRFVASGEYEPTDDDSG